LLNKVNYFIFYEKKQCMLHMNSTDNKESCKKGGLFTTVCGKGPQN